MGFNFVRKVRVLKWNGKIPTQGIRVLTYVHEASVDIVTFVPFLTYRYCRVQMFFGTEVLFAFTAICVPFQTVILCYVGANRETSAGRSYLFICYSRR